MAEPQFSAYPFDQLRRLSRRDAAIESATARWIAARPTGDRLAKLVGPVTIAIARAGAVLPIDPNAAICEVRIASAAIAVRGSSTAVRKIAQQLLGGPPELAAPRPLTVVEHAIWALIVATAVEDLGVAAEVWPCSEPNVEDPYAIELAIDLGGAPMLVVALVPRALELRAAPRRELPGWADHVHLAAQVVLGRCGIARSAVAALSLRDLITLDPPLATAELMIGSGAVGVRVMPGAVVAEVATGYVPHDMSLPDDAHVELTVALGTLQLSLRQVVELAVGQIVPLGRPLAGPFELRAEGQLVGRGELVNVDGELAVRVVSLGQE